MSRLVSVGNHYGAHEPFEDMFESVVFISPKQVADLKLQQGDVVLFGGGEDITPSFYNQKPIRYCHADGAPSHRDIFELAMFKLAKKYDVPMLGICRGAQLICALSGGSLIQHVTHHAGRGHMMTTKDGKNIHVCSVHHQMMNPFGIKHELIAWATDKLSTVYLVDGDKEEPMNLEPEVVYFPESKALGIQYHPEFMSVKEEAVLYSRELVKSYLLKGE